MCESSFTCWSEVRFAGYDLVGVQWFILMIVVAFILQVSANFIWFKSSQLSREILQRKPHSVGRKKLIGWRIFWTTMGTLNWILRITLVIGSNVWIFLIILIGNVTGVSWALEQQSADRPLPTADIRPECWSDDQIHKLVDRIKKLENVAEKKLVL